MESICAILAELGIRDAASVPLTACRVTKPYLLERLPFAPRSVCFGLIPYYTEAAAAPCRNVSVYAAPRDYHLFLSELEQDFLRKARVFFPENNFALFGDRSPFDERHGAAAAGLGILGDNGLLLTEEYSSYVFLFEIVSDLPADTVPQEPRHCEGCGACRAACPAKGNPALCLSLLTQKKGELTPEEAALVRAGGLAWGCDICGEVCPHTRAAREAGTLETPIAFFHKNIITQITENTIENEADFAKRAYSWRKKETVLRNLRLLQKKDDT